MYWVYIIIILYSYRHIKPKSQFSTPKTQLKTLPFTSPSPPSGAEDKHGYIWDRHYNICLARLQHDDVVNSVAFSPADQELLLSASDDSTIKVWRSPRMVRLAQTPAHPPRPRNLLSWLGRHGSSQANVKPGPS